MNTRRLSGAALRVMVTADRLPVVGAGLRAVAQSMIPLDVLRDASLGTLTPYLTPDDPPGTPLTRGLSGQGTDT